MMRDSYGQRWSKMKSFPRLVSIVRSFIGPVPQDRNGENRYGRAPYSLRNVPLGNRIKTNCRLVEVPTELDPESSLDNRH